MVRSPSLMARSSASLLPSEAPQALKRRRGPLGSQPKRVVRKEGRDDGLGSDRLEKSGQPCAREIDEPVLQAENLGVQFDPG